MMNSKPGNFATISRIELVLAENDKPLRGQKVVDILELSMLLSAIIQKTTIGLSERS